MNRQTRLLVFRLNDRLCALYLEQVLQVVHAVDATPLPQAPEIVLGAIDLHGDIVPLLNIRRRFGFSDRDVRVDDQFIIAKTTNRIVALAVDEVREIIDRAADRIIPAENIVGRLEHVDGVIQLEDGLALIHDLDKFLSLNERHELEHAMAGEASHGR
jgi:purine-binding chemotaxis protein CheW